MKLFFFFKEAVRSVCCYYSGCFWRLWYQWNTTLVCTYFGMGDVIAYLELWQRSSALLLKVKLFTVNPAHPWCELGAEPPTVRDLSVTDVLQVGHGGVIANFAAGLELHQPFCRESRWYFGARLGRHAAWHRIPHSKNGYKLHTFASKSK